MRDEAGWAGDPGGAYSSARGQTAPFAAPRDARQAAYARPRYVAQDVVVLLWRERLMMLVVFAVLLAIGAGVALAMPKTYTAHASLLIRLGQEYVYEPRVGDAARGATPQKDEVVQSEAEILGSDALKRRVIQSLGVAAIDPKLGAEWAAAAADRRPALEAAALKILQRGLSVSTSPESNVVRLDLKHADPAAAARILNTLVDTYLQYRREIFADISSPSLEHGKALVEGRLRTADAAFQAFLTRNAVADFPTEKTALAAAYQSVFDEKLKTEAQLREVQGQVAGLQARIGEAPGEIELQRDVDLSAPTQLLKLRTDRQALLARYLPTAQPVKDIDAQIGKLESLIASGQGVGEKDRRLGANPVRQQIDGSRISLGAQANALADRRAELSRQLAQIQARQLRLTSMESEYQSLAAERDALQANVKEFTTSAARHQSVAEIGADNIRIIEKAAPPADGKSLRRIAFGLALLFAAFTALCAGLARAFTRRGFATARLAERTLDLPVLATIPLKA